MLEVRGLHKRYGDLVAVHDVSFVVGSGEMIGLLGQNIPTATANKTVRDTMPIVASCHLRTLSQTIRTGRDFDGERVCPPLEEARPAAEPNGGKRPGASARRMAAGVRAAEETGDDGGPDRSEVPEIELARAFFRGEINAEEVARRLQRGGAGPDRPDAPSDR